MPPETQVHYFTEPHGPPKDGVAAVCSQASAYLSPLQHLGASVQVGYAHRHEDGSMPHLGTYSLLAEMHRDLGYVPQNQGHSVVAKVEIPARHAHRLDALLPVLEETCGLVRVVQSNVDAK